MTETSSGDEDFLQIIRTLAAAFSNQTQTEAQQADFFRMADWPRKRLPQNSSAQTAEQFVLLTITMISEKARINAHFSAKAIKVLHTFLRYDPQVFQMFRPNKPLLMKMRMEEHILSVNPAEAESALELTYFLLRYHRAVDFGDFSEKLHVTQRIRRYHDYKVWYEFESLSGQHEDLTGNFADFKTVTQNALKEIMLHLEKVSQDSGGLKHDIDQNMTSLNAQIDRYRAQAAGASESDEKYKSLLDLVMHLENKLNQTSKTMVGNLRKEFTETLERSRGQSTTQNDLQKLRRELEQFVSERDQRNEVSYQRLYESLGALDSKYDQRFTGQVDQLKVRLEDQILGRHNQLETVDIQNLQRMQDLLRQLENKVDTRTAETVRNFQSEIIELKSKHIHNLDKSFKDLEQQLQALGEQLDKSNSAHSETFVQLELKLQKMITDRQTKSEQASQQSQEAILETIASLERKIERRLEAKLQEVNHAQTRLDEEQKVFATQKAKLTYERFQAELDTLERQVIEKQDQIQVEFKNEFDRILGQSVQKAEGLTSDSYQRLVKMLQDTEKRIDLKQQDLIATVQADFKRIVTSLDNSQVIQELEAKFQTSLSKMQQEIEIDNRAMQGSFDAALRQLDSAKQKQLNDAIRNVSEAQEKQLEERLASQMGRVTRETEQEIQKAKDYMMLQISSIQDVASRQVAEKLQSGLEEAKVRHNLDLEFVRNELSTRLQQTIDRRLNDHTQSFNLETDTKIGAALARENDHITRRTSETLLGLRQYADTAAQSALESMNKQFNSKLEMGLRDFSVELSASQADIQQTKDHVLKQNFEKLRANFNERIAETVKNLDEQKQFDLKAQDARIVSYIDQLSHRFDQVGINYDQLSLGLSGQMNELKTATQERLEQKATELRQAMDKMLFDSQTNLDLQFRQVMTQQIADSENKTSAEVEQKIRAAMKRTGAQAVKAAGESRDEALKKFSIEVLEQANKLGQASSDKVTSGLEDQIKTIFKNATEQIGQLDIKIKQTHSATLAECDEIVKEQIAVFAKNAGGGFGQSSPQIIAELKDSIETVKNDLKTSQERISNVDGHSHGLESEIENIINIKISNMTNSLTKSMKQQLENINNQYVDQTKESLDAFQKRLEGLEQVANLNSQNPITEKVQRMEAALTDQVDMIQTLNDRMSQSGQLVSQLSEGVQKQLEELEKNIGNMMNEKMESIDVAEDIKEIREIIGALQRNDDKMQIDLYHVQSIVGEEGKFVVEMQQIQRNHDELVKKLLESERENEARIGESNQRLSNAVSEITQKYNGNAEIIRRMGLTIHQLENDVRVQIDNSIKVLEEKQVNQQKEIKAVQDGLDQTMARNEDFQKRLNTNIGQELAKINQNFNVQRKDVDDKELRQQETIKLIQSELKKQIERVGNVEKMGRQVESIQSFTHTLSKFVQETNDKISKLVEKTAKIEETQADTNANLGGIQNVAQQVQTLHQKNEAFEKFIQKQAQDQVHIAQSRDDHTVEQKLFAIEWMARYMEYYDVTNAYQVAQSFRQEYVKGPRTSPNNQQDAMKLRQYGDLYGHSTQTIKTVVVQLRQVRDNPSNRKEEHNTKLLTLLEPLLHNGQNQQQFIEMDGIGSILLDIIKEHWMQRAAQNQDQIVSYQLANKCLETMNGNNEALKAILGSDDLFDVVLGIMETTTNEDYIVNVGKIIENCAVKPSLGERMIELYPRMNIFLVSMVKQARLAPQAKIQALGALETVLANYLTQRQSMEAIWYQELAMLKTLPEMQGHHKYVDKVLVISNRKN